MPRDQQLLVMLDAYEKDRLQEAARLRRWSMSTLVREAIDDYLSRYAEEVGEG